MIKYGSKQPVTLVQVVSRGPGPVGQLIDLSMVDNTVLEIRGLNGTLRVDLTLKELEDMTSKIRSSRTSRSDLGSGTSTKKKV